jgi:hypothetical protein
MFQVLKQLPLCNEQKIDPRTIKNINLEAFGKHLQPASGTKHGLQPTDCLGTPFHACLALGQHRLDSKISTCEISIIFYQILGKSLSSILYYLTLIKNQDMACLICILVQGTFLYSILFLSRILYYSTLLSKSYQTSEVSTSICYSFHQYLLLSCTNESYQTFSSYI